jgi:hypothetical protein
MNFLIAKYQLTNASPEYVFNWLEKNTGGDDFGYDMEDKEELERSLLSRKNNLINLGLALYGKIPAIAYELYALGGIEIQLAVLGSKSIGVGFRPWIINKDVIPSLIKCETDELNSDSEKIQHSLLSRLLKNRHIPDRVLESLFKREEPFDNASDEMWSRLLQYASYNERLSTPYDEAWMDGFADFSYHAVFHAGWNVSMSLPVTMETANTMWVLANSLVPKSLSLDVFEAVERWRSDNEQEDKKYSKVRAALLKLIQPYTSEFKELVKSNDVGYRISFYNRVSSISPENLIEWYEKDDEVFLDCATQNKFFFKDSNVRNTLNKLCWDHPDERSSMDYPNYFKVTEERLMSEHPEWFKDSWSGEIPFDEIEDPDERKERRLKYLSSQVSDLKKAIVGDEDVYEDTQDPNEFDVRSAFTNIAVQVDLLNSQLQEFYRGNSFSWGTLLAGLVVGFILASYVS